MSLIITSALTEDGFLITDCENRKSKLNIVIGLSVLSLHREGPQAGDTSLISLPGPRETNCSL